MAIAKIFKKAKKLVKKRYTAKRGGLRMTQLYRDVALVKRSLNVEKKHIQSAVTTGVNIGQCNGNNDTGPAYYDISPAITQGVGYNQMTGNSVKLVSMAIFGQIYQQSSTAHPMKIKVELWKYRGQPIATATVQTSNQLYDKNPLTLLTDYNSQRNTNFFKDFTLIKRKICYLSPDPSSGEVMLADFKMTLKASHHMKWNQNTTTLTDGQLFLTFHCDSGNASATVINTASPIPVVRALSGATAQFYTKFFYVDN